MNTQQCFICYDDELFHVNDPKHSHDFGCRNCLTTWIITKIKETQVAITDEIPCLFSMCSNKIQIQKVFGILPKSSQKRINEALFQVYLINEKDIRKCPNPKCSYAGIIENSSCNDPLQCARCDTQWIDYWQSKVSIGVFSDYKNELFSNIRKCLLTKKCPNCNKRIEKFGGCPHMTCSQCKFEFCWICLGKYPSHNEFPHLFQFIIKIILFLTAVITAFILCCLLYMLPPVRFLISSVIIPTFSFIKNNTLWIYSPIEIFLLWSGEMILKLLLLNIGAFRNFKYCSSSFESGKKIERYWCCFDMLFSNLFLWFGMVYDKNRIS